jgi:hypothetical protein
VSVRKFFRTAAFTLLIGTLAACSTLHRKAEKLMDARVFDQAQTIYLEILAHHPKDTDALIGLKKAREGSIGDQLIEVRQQRLGGNTEEAAERLRQILISIKDWKVYPGGAVASTQNEEVDYAVRDLERESRIALAQNHPLRVAFLLERFSSFFQEKRLQVLEALRHQASDRGLDDCRRGLASSAKGLTFYREYLARECVYFGDQRAELKEPVVHGLYNRVNLTGQVSGLPDFLKVSLENEAQKTMQDSPWYDAKGPRTLSVAYDGTYAFGTERRHAIFTHAYEEQEPYTEEEFVTKHRSHPVSVTKSFTQPDGKSGTVSTTEYADETYTERETVTHLRTVTRSFNYDGTEIEQNINLHTTLRATLLSSPVVLTSSISDRNMSSESQTNIPVKGLYARTAVIKNENEWFAAQLARWHTQNLSQLRDLWSRNYCQGFSADAALERQGNTVFQCLRDNSKPAPALMDGWLQTHEGVSASELQAVLKTNK